MGNASTRDKNRHISGDDTGPTMKVHDLIASDRVHTSSARNVGSPMEDVQSLNSSSSKSKRRSDLCVSMRPESLEIGVDVNSKKLPTVFKWDGGGKNVSISGSFDNWTRQIPMVKSQGDFYTIVDLPEGTHQYKFFVDGQWVCDKNANSVENEVGTKNNSMIVKSSDFEVFEALAIDSQTTLPNSPLTATDVSGSSPPGEYSQNIPARSSSAGFHQSGPPILPPHLLQVILNKEVPQHCEPTLLPEPNHVMLNHLYALSIKDGVMVLSATVRYRKKYVTTLLYKPI